MEKEEMYCNCNNTQNTDWLGVLLFQQLQNFHSILKALYSIIPVLVFVL
jgi:hypothetical protein